MDALRACVSCGTALSSRDQRRVTCGSRACAQQRAREVNAEWAAANRNVRRRNTWLVGQPLYQQPTLPGGGIAIILTPPPRWPIEHRNVRGLHGLVSDCLGVAHDPQIPRFSLVPWRSGWSVYLSRDEDLQRLAGQSFSARLYDQPLTARFGAMVFRLATPRVPKRGHRRLALEFVTPVVVRQSQRPQPLHAGLLISTLTAWLPRRIGLVLAPDVVRLRVVERALTETHVPLGGKYGTVSGWTGRMVVETNAPGEWLLRLAAQIGLGGRVAFGFGRVVVRPC